MRCLIVSIPDLCPLSYFHYLRNWPYLTGVQWDISDLPFVQNKIKSCSKHSVPCRIQIVMATKRKNFKNLLVKNYLSDLKIIWYKWSLGGLYQSWSNYFDWLKNVAARGRGWFFLC